jgi:hypothetical protein
MRSSTRIPVLLLVMMVVGGLGPLVAQEASGRQAVDPLIGTWSLNVAKSQFSGTPPKATTRTFDYTLDGMILVTIRTTNAQGNTSFVHWFLGLDGKEHPEFGRPTGASPIWFLSAKIIDTHTKEILDRQVVAPGQPQRIINYTFAVSPDGNTFTSTARSTNAQGEPRVTVQVYDKVF